MTFDDYEQVKEYLDTRNIKTDNEIVDTNVGGIFYVIQLEPEHDPGRYKLGFATNIEERIRSHKTSAPFSKLLKTWPCKLLWEKTAIDCVSQDSERLYTEIFRTESIDDVISRCDQFFELMPDLNSE